MPKKTNTFESRFRMFPLNKIKPPHYISRRCKSLEYIANSLKKHGWQGRPLILMAYYRKNQKKHQALTGSHRNIAAHLSNLKKIPVILLNKKETEVILKLWKKYPQEFLPDILAKTFRDVGFRELANLLIKDEKQHMSRCSCKDYLLD